MLRIRTIAVKRGVKLFLPIELGGNMEATIWIFSSMVTNSNVCGS